MIIRPSQIRSSLPLEILLFVNIRISALIFIALVGAYIYKLTYFHYPQHSEAFELIILIAFPLLECLRISWARRGNLTETPTFISFALLIGVGVIGICVYFGVLQNYVLLVDRICAGIQGGLVLLETVFGVAAVASFSRPTAVPANRI